MLWVKGLSTLHSEIYKKIIFLSLFFKPIFKPTFNEQRAQRVLGTAA